MDQALSAMDGPSGRPPQKKTEPVSRRRGMTCSAPRLWLRDRLWERPAEALLAGPLGAAPLAVLGSLPERADLIQGLTGIAQRLIERLEREAESRQKKLLLTAAFVLTGLRLRRNQALQVFAGVRAMRGSDTFQAILDEGRETEARRLIRRLAARTLGEPDEPTVTRLEGITDIERLERIFDRAMEASSWQDLLDTP